MERRIEPGQQTLMTVGEVAEWLGCTERMVRKLKANRQIASVKVGRLVRFHPVDVDGYIHSRRVERVG